jgi:hypothetical protein
MAPRFSARAAGCRIVTRATRTTATSDVAASSTKIQSSDANRAMSAPSAGPITNDVEPAPSIHALMRSSPLRSSARNGAKDATAVMTGAPKNPSNPTIPVSCHIVVGSIIISATGTKIASAAMRTRRGS